MKAKKSQYFSKNVSVIIFVLGITYIVGGYLFLQIFKNNNPKVTKPQLTSLLDFNTEFSSTSSEHAVLDNSSSTPRLVISKIGVDMPIIMGEPNPDEGLLRGAWHVPGSATPNDNSGYNNMVISGHRFRYTSGPLTLYSLDKIKVGDEIVVDWQGKSYRYIVRETKVVSSNSVDILNKSPSKVLTIFTCTPLFTTLKRLVVVADLNQEIPKQFDNFK